MAVDRRGRGGSGDASDYAFEREVEDVAAVVDWAGKGVSLLGHSYGGMCALEAALVTGGLEKLVLYEAPLGFLKSPPPDSPDPFKEAGEAVRTALPDCRVAVMPGQRHGAMDTGTELFTTETLSFLEDG